MGNWKIEIEGCGIHHNNRPDDAEQMAADFVAQLRAKGHTIQRAKLTLLSYTTVAQPTGAPTDVCEILAKRDPK